MKILFTLQDKKRIIHFGIPLSNQEYKDMFQLRYRVYYEEMRYGETGLNITDKDQFDMDGEVLYLIAKIEEIVVGCLRIVTNSQLPIERFYRFKKAFPTSNKGDWGRLISRPHWFGYTDLSRGLISTGLLLTSILLSDQKNIKYGYGVMKQRAFKKIKSRGFPVQVMHPTETIGIAGIDQDPLQNFFSIDDTVVPLSFNLLESKKFMLLLQENYFEEVHTNYWRIPEKVSVKKKLNIWVQSIWIRLAY
jgi:N-acyl-L-homoserine lactone synthetase